MKQRWRNWRAEINRDDGHFYRAGNRNLRSLEIAGHGLLVAAVLLWVIDAKIGIDLSIPAVISMVFGVGLLLINALMRRSQEH